MTLKTRMQRFEDMRMRFNVRRNIKEMRDEQFRQNFWAKSVFQRQILEGQLERAARIYHEYRRQVGSLDSQTRQRPLSPAEEMMRKEMERLRQEVEKIERRLQQQFGEYRDNGISVHIKSNTSSRFEPPGFVGQPLSGQSAKAEANASDRASSAPATSRVRAARKAMSLP